MKQDVYELKNSLESYKRMLRSAQLSLELIENNYNELKEELERMKRIYEPKSRCANCIGGRLAHEIKSKVCNPTCLT